MQPEEELLSITEREDELPVSSITLVVYGVKSVQPSEGVLKVQNHALGAKVDL